MLVLDSSGVSALAARSPRAVAQIRAFLRVGLWPAVVPTVAMVECLVGRADRDAATNRFLRTCNVAPVVSGARARRAAFLRSSVRRGSAVDAVVVATAEPHGTVYTGDADDLIALAAYSDDVRVERA